MEHRNRPARLVLLLLLATGFAHGRSKHQMKIYLAARSGDKPALQELTAIAMAGNAHAQFTLYRIYAMGEGTPRDSTAAMIWLRKAAELGDVSAQWMLGFEYDNGGLVSKDSMAAAIWLNKAAEQGNTDAQNILGSTSKAMAFQRIG
jgi:TPR repeat protein